MTKKTKPKRSASVSASAADLGKLQSKAKAQAVKYSPSLLGKLSNSELAQKIAKTADKKSKEYKAAMRNLQRYRKGERKPTGDTKKKIERAARAVVKSKPEKAARLYSSGVVKIAGVICYSADCRKRELQVKLSASAMGAFLEASRQSSEEGEAALFEFYGVPGMYIQSGKVSIEFDQ